tara:strand:- start:206 stop:541 length:336 start_codon:yes stop_codon:yes gene_type:complete
VPPELRKSTFVDERHDDAVDKRLKLFRLDYEKQKDSDQEAKDAERFRHGESEDQVTKLALSCGRVAHGCVQIAGENVTNAECCAEHGETGKTSANVLQTFFHFGSPKSLSP